MTAVHFPLLHQYKEEYYTVDRELVSVSMRVQLGDFLKIMGTDIEDRGTVKNISSDGKVDLMTDSDVSISEHDDNIYLLTYIIGEHCRTSLGPNRDYTWFYFHESSICWHVGDTQDARSRCWSNTEGKRSICTKSRLAQKHVYCGCRCVRPAHCSRNHHVA